MIITLPYGKEKVAMKVPDENVYFVVDKGDIPAIKKPEEHIGKALSSPINMPTLPEVVNPWNKVVIVGDDVTRPTPQDIILPVFLNKLNAAGVPDRNIEVVIALGTHRKMTKKEIREKYGSEVVDRISVVNHDYKDYENLVEMGKTGSSIPVSINKKVADADFVVGVGNIVPHPYAGWGGGGKIIQPGICGEETTAMTHVMASKVRPIRKLAGELYNRIRREIDAIALKAGLKMIINTVLNQDDKIAQVTVGDPLKAFREGVKIAERIYRPIIPGYADIIVVSSYPSDIDYWQAAKSLYFASTAVKQNGTIVLTTPCPDRVSPTHPIFTERATLGYEENLKAIEEKEINDMIAGADLLLHAQILERAEVVCYSDGLTERDKEALGFAHAATVQEAIEMALESQGKKARIGVLECGEILPIIT